MSWIVQETSPVQLIHQEFFFLPDLFLLIKKATAIFVTKYITGIIIYKICRYLHHNEYKAKFSNQIHLGDSFRGCFIFWALNTLYISLAKEDQKDDKKDRTRGGMHSQASYWFSIGFKQMVCTVATCYWFLVLLWFYKTRSFLSLEHYNRVPHCPKFFSILLTIIFSQYSGTY